MINTTLWNIEKSYRVLCLLFVFFFWFWYIKGNIVFFVRGPHEKRGSRYMFLAWIWTLHSCQYAFVSSLCARVHSHFEKIICAISIDFPKLFHRSIIAFVNPSRDSRNSIFSPTLHFTISLSERTITHFVRYRTTFFHLKKLHCLRHCCHWNLLNT